MTYFMAKEKEIKTNAMRILDRMKIPYTHYTRMRRIYRRHADRGKAELKTGAGL